MLSCGHSQLKIQTLRFFLIIIILIQYLLQYFAAYFALLHTSQAETLFCYVRRNQGEVGNSIFLSYEICVILTMLEIHVHIHIT